MNHQQFEEWLFSEEPLTLQETAKFEEHLRTCDACRLLSQAWQEVESQLRIAPMAVPQPGFTSRWQERQAMALQRLHRRQSLAMLGFSVTGAVLLLASLVILAWPWLQSPDLLLWTWISRLMNLASVTVTLERVLVAILQAATKVIPWPWWILITGLLCELAVLWLISYRLLTNPRSITK